MKTFTLSLVAAVALALSAAPASAAVSWSKQIYPILQKKCLGCHSDLGTKGGLNLEKRENMLKGGAKHGPAVIPGKADGGALIKLVTTTDLKLRMPPKGKPVDAAELDLFKKWIAEGAQFDGEGSLDLGSIVYKPLPDSHVHVFSTALSPNGKMVAFGRASEGKSRIEVWDVDASRRVKLLEGPKDVVRAIAFSPDGKLLVAGEHLRLWVFSTDDWKHVTTVDGHVERIMAVAFSKDGKLLAATSGLESKSGFIHIYDTAGFKEQRRIEAHTDEIQSVAFSPDGVYVGSGSADKLAKIHEVATGKFVKQFAGHTHHVQGVAFNADGKQMVTGGADNDIKLWDVQKGEQTKTAKGHTKQVTGLVYRPDGKSFFTTSGDKTVREWTPAGAVSKNYTAFTDYAYGISIAADGSRIAAGSHDGTVRVWATAGATVVREITRATPAEPAGGAAPPPPADPKTKPKGKEKDMKK